MSGAGALCFVMWIRWCTVVIVLQTILSWWTMSTWITVFLCTKIVVRLTFNTIKNQLPLVMLSIINKSYMLL